MCQLYKYHNLNLLNEKFKVISPHGFDMGNTGYIVQIHEKNHNSLKEVCAYMLTRFGLLIPTIMLLATVNLGCLGFQFSYSSPDANKDGSTDFIPDKNDFRGQIRFVPVESSNLLAMKGLAEGVKKWTDIQVIIDTARNIDSPNLRKYPFIYVKGVTAESTKRERRGLGEYIDSGGFLVLETSIRSFNEISTDISNRIRLRPVPKDHKLLNCCFLIEPSIWDRKMDSYLGSERNEDSKSGRYLNGLWIGGNLVGVLSDVSLDGAWQDYSLSNMAGNEVFIRLGVNIVVYSLNR